MKALIAAASLAAITASIPAFAQAQAAQSTTSGTTFYGNLGYDYTDSHSLGLSSIQARLGARFGQYLGVEGEGSLGLNADHTSVGGGDVKGRIRHQEAIYGVGFLPVAPNLDLLARVGYGNTSVRASTPVGSAVGHGESWNYGAGAQYHFDSVNGVRADYTREEFTHGNGSANVWSIAYTRRF